MSLEAMTQILVRIDRENSINCTGLGEVGCTGRQGWHSWHEHREHVAESQVSALIEAGYVAAVSA